MFTFCSIENGSLHPSIIWKALDIPYWKSIKLREDRVPNFKSFHQILTLQRPTMRQIMENISGSLRTFQVWAITFRSWDILVNAMDFIFCITPYQENYSSSSEPSLLHEIPKSSKKHQEKTQCFGGLVLCGVINNISTKNSNTLFCGMKHCLGVYFIECCLLFQKSTWFRSSRGGKVRYTLLRNKVHSNNNNTLQFLRLVVLRETQGLSVQFYFFIFPLFLA